MLHAQQLEDLKTKAAAQYEAMKQQIKDGVARTAQLQACLHRAEGCAVRKWKEMEQLEKERKLAEKMALNLSQENEQLKDSNAVLTAKIRQQKAFHATLRRKKTNNARTHKREVERARRESASAKAANSSGGAITINMRKSQKPQSHVLPPHALF